MTLPPPFDPHTASIEALMAHYPDLGLFAAQDIVAWREQNGRFERAAPLIELGLSVELAEQLVVHSAAAKPEALVALVAEREIGPDHASPAPPRTATPSLAPVARSVAPRQIRETDDLRPSIKPEAWPALQPSPAPTIEPASPQAAQSNQARASAEAPGDAASSSTVDAGAALQATLTAASTIPAPPEPPAPSVSSVLPVRRSRAYSIALIAIAMANAALLAGLVALRGEEQRARAPVAAISVEVTALHAKQQDDAARLDDTQVRLEKQNDALTSTIERVRAVEVRQADAERETKDGANREATRAAALGARMDRVEKKVGDAYTLAEALELIDLSREPAPRPSGTPEPKQVAGPRRPVGQTARDLGD